MILLYLCVTYAGAAGGVGGADARRLGRRRIPRALQQQLLPQVPGAHLCFTSSSCLAHVALYCVRGLAGSRACCAVLELKGVAPCTRVMGCSSLGALEAVHLHAFGKCLHIHRKCFDLLLVFTGRTRTRGRCTRTTGGSGERQGCALGVGGLFLRWQLSMWELRLTRGVRVLCGMRKVGDVVEGWVGYNTDVWFSVSSGHVLVRWFV